MGAGKERDSTGRVRARLAVVALGNRVLGVYPEIMQNWVETFRYLANVC